MYETERCSRSCGPKRGFPKQQTKAKSSLFLLLKHTGSPNGSRSREGEADQQEGRTRPGSGARRRPREAADAGRTHAENTAGEKRAAKPMWGPTAPHEENVGREGMPIPARRVPTTPGPRLCPSTAHPSPRQLFEGKLQPETSAARPPPPSRVLLEVNCVTSHQRLCTSQGRRVILERTFWRSCPLPRARQMKDGGWRRPARSAAAPSSPPQQQPGAGRSTNPPTRTSLYLTRCNQSHQIPS